MPCAGALPARTTINLTLRNSIAECSLDRRKVVGASPSEATILNMNIWLIIVPVLLIGIGISLFFILRKNNNSTTIIHPTQNIKLIINVGKIESKV